MATLNLNDLNFILQQIHISEQIAAFPRQPGQTDAEFEAAKLAFVQTLIPDPHLPWGLRTVDGTFNNIIDGRADWGAADQPFPRLTIESYRIGTQDLTFDTNGPAPGGAGVGADYSFVTTPGNVVDTAPRTISNLIVDQTINNPAAVLAALAYHGIEGSAAHAITDPHYALIATQKAAIDAQRAVVIANPGNAAALAALTTLENTLANELNAFRTVLEANGVEFTTNGSLVIPNVAPDEGISAPFNSWMTLFGQFFDHGLDLVEKTAGTKVFIPLQPDDPLIAGADGHFGTADDLPASQRFMVVTRTIEDARNLTTPFVDQNQTYTSHASHQVFLREYAGTPGNVHSTGHLLEGSATNGGLATWADVKAQARSMLGLVLDDAHIHEVPLLATDEYGQFRRGPDGFAQVVVDVRLSNGTTVQALAEGNATGLNLRAITVGDLVAPISLPPGVTIQSITAVGTGHAFLDDIAHNAVPVLIDHDNNPLTPRVLAPDADDLTGNPVASVNGRNTEYDNELLDRHFMTGDGRGNENIGLTAVHHVFHSEHNRQVEEIKHTLAAGGVATLNNWLLTPLAADTVIPTDPTALDAFLDGLAWNGESLFQAARFATEMQYQHLVFEEFARKVNPAIELFVFNPTMDINPAIFAEFAHTVYRFGHSMLTETVDRLDADGNPLQLLDENGNPVFEADGVTPVFDQMGLIEAFLNPVAYNFNNTLSAEEAAGAIIRGMTRQQGNEIDEFVTEALRNNLLGLPLDLPAINLARGRETGIPTLQEARAELFAATQSDWLRPYASWVDFAQHLKNPASVINFIAAYGTHASITGADTLAEKRAAATLLVMGGIGEPTDRMDFLTGTGAYATGHGGLDSVDLWIGGLAEAILPFGGMLGSTFTAVFEAQLENLQNGDRFYYLSRTQGLNFLNELESNSFAEIIRLNTDIGTGNTHIPGEVFSTAQHILEVLQEFQQEPDPVHDNPILQALQPKVARNDVSTLDDVTRNGSTYTYDTMLKFTGGEHVVLGGTDLDDVLIADLGDDTIWGEGGNDYIIGGHGINRLHGGDGSDIIYGGADAEFLHGEAGNDIIHAGNGLGDLVFGDGGDDFLMAGTDAKEVFGGEGNDFILGSEGGDFLLGGAGDDWIEGGEGFDTIAGDNSQLFFNSDIIGHDVMFAGTNEMDFDAESGDDIMLPGESVARNEGMLGFDWVSYAERTANVPVVADMSIPVFTNVAADILRDRFDRVEAVSGSKFDDVILGDNRIAPTGPFNPNVPVNEQTLEGDALTLAGVDRIDGLWRMFTFVNNTGQRVEFASAAAMRAFYANNPDAIVFNEGNILLGGDGNDTLQGNGGDDIIDGDASLNVRIRIVNGAGVEIGTTDKMQGIVAWNTNATPAQQAMTGQQLDDLVFARVVDPGNLRIVREIVFDSTPGNVDVAVFRDVRDNYTIQQIDANSWRVVHNDTGAIEFDGADTLHNIEFLRFADQTVNIGNVPNNAPTGNLGITITQGTGNDAVFDLLDTLTVNLGTVADLDGRPPISSFVFTWQVETAPGSGEFTNLLDPLTGALIQGTSFTPTPAFELDNGVRLRVVGSFTDGHGVPEVATSLPTVPLVGLVPDPAAVLGLDLTVAPNNVGPDGVPVDPADFAPDAPIGIFEDVIDSNPATNLTAFTFTRANLLANVTIPTTGLVIANLVLRVRDGEPAAGVVAQTGPDTWAFDPAQDFNGGVTFTFDIIDTFGGVTPSEATLTVVGVNDAPAPAPVSLGQADAGTPPTVTFTEAQLFGNIPVDANGRPIDVDGDRLTIDPATVVLANPAQGTLIDNGDGTWTFTANANVFGDIVVNFTISDGTGLANGDVATSSVLTIGRTFTDGNGGNTINGTAAGDILDGAGGADTINGLAGNDLLNGGNAADVLNGGLGNDTLNGDAGADTLNGGDGNDTLNGGAGNDTVNGGAGNDTITYDVTNGGRDFIDGGENADASADVDTANITNATGTIRIYTRQAWDDVPGNNINSLNLNTEIVITRNGTGNGAIIAELDNIEEIRINGLDAPSSAGSVTLGGATVNVIGNFSGTSLLLNTITVTGGPGTVVNATGLESDHRIVFETGGTGGLFIGPARPQDVIDGSVQKVDAVVSGPLNLVLGTAANDVLRGSVTNDIVSGLAGNDILTGSIGDDQLLGGAGNDTLIAGAGNDTLEGGTGNDTLIAGLGNDTLVFAAGFGNDVVIGFDSNPAGGQDILDISSYGFTAADIGDEIQIAQSGLGTVVTIGGDSITLSGVSANTVLADDFKFA